MNKIVLIGAVSSTEQTLKKLIEHGFEILAVFGFEPDSSKNVSGLRKLNIICKTNNIEYFSFQKINESINVELIKNLRPDIIFAVGFSQLIGEEILNLAQKGIIGFHPTVLPHGRGRAPIAWTVMNEKEGAASFFLLGDGVDNGPIFVQEPFRVDKTDDANIIEMKILKSIDLALDRWLPKLKSGNWNPIPQNEKEYSEYGRRAPLDGIIDWHDKAYNIDRLIKASSHPHPGAFTFYNDKKITIWKSRIEKDMKIQGVVGRVLRIDEQELLMQTGDGLLWVSDIDSIISPIVGSRFGYYDQYEIFKLKNEIKLIKQDLDELKRN